MTPLSDMKIKAINIGSTLSDKLLSVGINSIEALKSEGSENAFIRIRTIDPSACLNMLYALEGAIRDIRWHNLEESRKNELKGFFDTLK
jgi:DNA transformation protein and related proteins